ncbi:MAG: hypothetical protein PWQ51_2612 [Methanolobus sp.]|jgi:hypothetical protein|uniref:hypothetical protein n=1 Tax=unclassified Methanolobus TaxID=2629569 RepID=UPI0024AA87CB|nr:hypothetical protein [Methanolobus sp.]MDI3487100.1 hypothetical protein [Methanolobus sp.]MDK2831994.1 hypothetical protein [Methanolobus sp.]MDK2940447.1 hypothetical protein [Methanolobus sp.]
MDCRTCSYKKNIPLFSKCAGVPGRTRVGTAYYCSHPDMQNPVPVIVSENILEGCPVDNNHLELKKELEEAGIIES